VTVALAVVSYIGAAKEASDAWEALRQAEIARNDAGSAQRGAIEAKTRVEEIAKSQAALFRLTTEGDLLEAIKRHSADNSTWLGDESSGFGAEDSAREFLKFLLDDQQGAKPRQWSDNIIWSGWVRDHATMLNAYRTAFWSDV
jgi:hypothetical protein